MKLEENPQLPIGVDSAYSSKLNFVLSRIFRSTAQKLNQLGDGRISGCGLVASSVPTTGSFSQGDFVRNSAPVEAGTAGSKYVILGWVCVAGGTPGTLLPVRTLTGN